MHHWKDIREERAFHQREVAEYLGISRSAYSNYENGTRSPDIGILKKLADLFCISMDELLDYSPGNRRESGLSWKEKGLLCKYRTLSVNGQLRIQKQLDLELEMEAKAARSFRGGRDRSPNGE